MYYSGYNFIIQSDISFNELETVTQTDKQGLVDISIQSDDISAEGIDSPQTTGLFYQLTEKKCWVHIPNVAYFLMCDGVLIKYALYPAISPETIKEFILTLCFPIILLQRQLCVLRATTIKIQDACFAIAGMSGVGKSTLAAAFLQRGYDIVSDDYSVLSVNQDMIPGFPFLKLWRKTLQKLDMNIQSLKVIRPGIQKYIFPLVDNFYTHTLPVVSVYTLNDMNQEAYSFSEIKGVKKINVLNNMVYGHCYAQGGALNASIKRQLFNLAQHISVHSIIRPSDTFELADCIDYIEKTLPFRDTA